MVDKRLKTPLIYIFLYRPAPMLPVSAGQEKTVVPKEKHFSKIPLQEESVIVAESSAMRKTLSQARFAALGGDRPILIRGEIGVGKSHLARYIRAISPRAAGPFTEINCGSVSADLDNLLFGHRRGAFTGAVTSMKGRLELTDGGTLLLDDIDRLSLRHQDLFHRVVVDGEVFPLGHNRPLRTSFRLISTTNKDVDREVDQGRLKSDFLSRINYFEIRMPPLRERLEDLRGLVRLILDRESRALKKVGYLAPETRAIEIQNDFWPALKARKIQDNVRGLDKIVVQLLAVLVVENRFELTSRDLDHVLPALEPLKGAYFEHSKSLREVRDAAERDYIKRVVHYTDSNIRQAARILGVSPKHLYTKLRHYGIRFRDP